MARVRNRIRASVGRNLRQFDGLPEWLGMREGLSEDARIQKKDGVTFGVVRFTYKDLIGTFDRPATAPGNLGLSSKLCQQEDFAYNEFRHWCAAIRENPVFHRKQWEFFFICQALHERDMLRQGNRGLGFGVGVEPLPSLFASMGCEIVATDQAIADAQRGGWVDTNQHAFDIHALNQRAICPSEDFAARTSFRVVDMNNIPDDLAGFDFCWSACCLEHLGSLEHGMRFVERSLKTLKPGGVAVHTTEFNLSSDDHTYESRDLSLYRRRDVETLVDRLTRDGHHVAPINWNRGSGRLDKVVDVPPFAVEPHLRLELASYNCTSIGLIVTKKA
jgi:SAM-dependent methyltransferase